MHKILHIFFIVLLSLIVALENFAQTTHVIFISNNQYTPNSLTIPEGDIIVFELAAGAGNFHPTVSDDSPALFAPFTLQKGGDQSGQFTPGVGIHNFHCNNHGVGAGTMKGAITVSAVSGSNEGKENKYELIVSPNPFEDQVMLSINPGNKNLKELKIYDLIGKEVTSIDLSTKQGSSRYNVDFSNLKAGVYFCNVYSDKGIIETKKLFRTK